MANISESCTASHVVFSALKEGCVSRFQPNYIFQMTTATYQQSFYQQFQPNNESGW